MYRYWQYYHKHKEIRAESVSYTHLDVYKRQALNEALLRQFSIRFLVTKDGGAAGGFAEKAAAAAAAEAQLIVLRRPREEGADYDTVLRRCREVLGCR